MDVDEEYAEALEARRQALLKRAEEYDKAEAAYSRKVEKWRAAVRKEKERVKDEADRIRELKRVADEAHTAFALAAEAKHTLMAEYVDRELIERRDKLSNEIARLKTQEQTERGFAGMYAAAIRAGEVRAVKMPQLPKPGKDGERPIELEHRQATNPKRFRDINTKVMLEKRRDDAELKAEEIKSKWEALEPKLVKAEAELEHAIAEAFRNG